MDGRLHSSLSRRLVSVMRLSDWVWKKGGLCEDSESRSLCSMIRAIDWKAFVDVVLPAIMDEHSIRYRISRRLDQIHCPSAGLFFDLTGLASTDVLAMKSLLMTSGVLGACLGILHVVQLTVAQNFQSARSNNPARVLATDFLSHSFNDRCVRMSLTFSTGQLLGARRHLVEILLTLVNPLSNETPPPIFPKA